MSKRCFFASSKRLPCEPVLVISFFLGVVLGAWAVGQFGIYSAYVGFLPLAVARTFIAVGTAPLESETPEETAVEAAEEMEEAEKLEKEQKL